MKIEHRLKIQDEVLQKFPNYKAIVLYVSGFVNLSDHTEALKLLREAEAFARAHFDAQTLSIHPHIAAWRATYSDFGSKPSKYLCSAEALLKRTLKGNDLPQINMIVDLYNAISIRYVIPIGGEDWDGLKSDLELGLADGTEPFVTRSSGEEVTEHPDKGEVVWRDAEGVTCRRWNWRQCERTAITSSTERAYFVFDYLPPYEYEQLTAAVEDFSLILKELCPNCSIEKQELP